SEARRGACCRSGRGRCGRVARDRVRVWLPRARCAAGEGGEDLEDVAVFHGRVERLEVADVLVIDVDVDELVQGPVRGLALLAEAGLLAVEVLQQLADGVAVRLDLLGANDALKDRSYFYLDCQNLYSSVPPTGAVPQNSS